jgi:hypothetical protein
VTPGRRDFERAFGGELSAHVDEVAVNCLVVCVEDHRGGAPAPFRTVTQQHRDRRTERVDGVEFDPGDERGFVGIASGNDQL